MEELQRMGMQFLLSQPTRASNKSLNFEKKKFCNHSTLRGGGKARGIILASVPFAFAYVGKPKESLMKFDLGRKFLKRWIVRAEHPRAFGTFPARHRASPLWSHWTRASWRRNFWRSHSFLSRPGFWSIRTEAPASQFIDALINPNPEQKVCGW